MENSSKKCSQCENKVFFLREICDECQRKRFRYMTEWQRTMALDRMLEYISELQRQLEVMRSATPQ